MHIISSLTLFSFLLFAPFYGFAASDDTPEFEKGFIGIAYSVTAAIPHVDGLPPITGGILVSSTRDGTPASRAGIRSGDIIISIEGFLFDESSGDTEEVFQSVLDNCQPGDTLNLELIRMHVDKQLHANDRAYDPEDYLSSPARFINRLPDSAQMELQVTKEWKREALTLVLGRRNEGQLPAPPPLSETDLDGLFDRPEWESWVDELVTSHDIEEEFDDLRQRLQRLHDTDDGHRLPLITGIHRDPFLVESVATKLSDKFLNAKRLQDISLSEILLYKTGEKHHFEHPAFTNLDINTDADGFREWFTTNMQGLVEQLKAVYDVFSEEEKRFLMAHRFELFDAFSEHIYIDIDADSRRFERNKRALELGGRINQAALYEACDALLQFALGSYEEVFAWMENNPDVRRVDTPWGQVGFGTAGNDRWDDSNVKFIYDPAGNDIYTDGAGVAGSFDRPVAWVFDLAGDDAYQSTAPYGAQGSGVPGFGLVYDKAGNDVYIGQRLSQGTGYMGIGILYDKAGNDRYYGQEFVQGLGIFGMGLLFDAAGNDKYYGTKHTQGAGFTNGIGILFDAGGDDYAFATGKHPTNYGDPGIFDAWSQGVGMGFRNIASGGIGIVVSGGGNNYWEAGSFAQGGGYYYGMGVFRAGGNGDDTYIGSRYAQGFSAHQAIGAFIEDGGNDTYLTRHMASIGLAWDESVSFFIDKGGDDHYDGGSSFSLGASAHNSFSIFIDEGGNDHFQYNPGPARAGGNSYHGGHSFSLFVTRGSERNHFSSGRVKNDAELWWPDFGFFRDGKAIPQTE